MSIALSSPDGRVVGGLLGGLLTAAGPVQVPFFFCERLTFKVKQGDCKSKIDVVEEFFWKNSMVSSNFVRVLEIETGASKFYNEFWYLKVVQYGRIWLSGSNKRIFNLKLLQVVSSFWVVEVHIGYNL